MLVLWISEWFKKKIKINVICKCISFTEMFLLLYELIAMDLERYIVISTLYLAKFYNKPRWLIAWVIYSLIFSFLWFSSSQEKYVKIRLIDFVYFSVLKVLISYILAYCLHKYLTYIGDIYFLSISNLCLCL